MSRVLVSSILIASTALLTACAGNEGYADLDAFMKKADSKPAGRIEPLPDMVVYDSFEYSEAGSRSPFTPKKLIPRFRLLKIKATSSQIWIVRKKCLSTSS